MPDPQTGPDAARDRTPAFFRRAAPDRFYDLEPLPTASSRWGEGGGHMRGMAVSGALARAAEGAVVALDGRARRPARWRVDLFRAVAMTGCSVTTEVVRAGRRLCLIDAELVQGSRVMARASALFAAGGAPVPGTTWMSHDETPPPPPVGMRSATTEPRLYSSEGLGWTASPDPHHHARRKHSWHLPVDVLEGETSTPFQVLAMAADVVNVVTNWGSEGLAFINADIDVLLSRPPTAREVGLSALHRSEYEGVSGGTAVVFDRTGVLGTANALGLATGRVVDPRTLGRRDRRRPTGEPC